MVNTPHPPGFERAGAHVPRKISGAFPVFTPRCLDVGFCGPFTPVLVWLLVGFVLGAQIGV